MTNLTAADVIAVLIDYGVDTSHLVITEDPAVWTDLVTGASGTSVRIDGPKSARQAAAGVLWAQRLAHAPYPDHDYWSR